MASLFSLGKNILKSGLLEKMVDIHSHLLPGVDDGMESVKESYEACIYLEKIGVRRIVLTPHIMEDLPDNHSAYLKKCYDEFVRNHPTQIEFCLAGEYMLDNGFNQHIREGLLTIGGNYVLVESSYMAASTNMYSILYELSVSGYKPLIAHPERYLYLSIDELIALKKLNYSFQINLMSLAGIYGKEVRRRALFLLEGDNYDFVGSDIHRLCVYHHALSNLYLSKKELDKVSILIDNNRRFGWK